MNEEPSGGRFSDNRGAGRRERLAAIAIVAAIHLAAILALIKGLAAAGVIADPFVVTQAFNVPLPPSPPPPSPAPSAPAEKPAGKAAPEAAKARPRDVAAPRPRLPAKVQPVPPVAASGSENRSGAGNAGAGTGGGGTGNGTGSGGQGDGAGSGMARAAEKIAGDINAIRDYPRAGRDARLGRSVTIEMTVGTDGRARDCRVISSSGDLPTDQITCRLATDRFRFRPRTNAAGTPVETWYRWRQRFFTP